jgi:NADPH:quinone reductase-like Zn-dependent oxidoreductase
MNQQSKTMKAVAIDEFGGIEKMRVRDLPIPQVGPDEVLVHVETAGVGAWDPFEREGGFAKEFGVKPQFPYILGADGAGTVESVGKEVHGLKKGDRVYGINLMNPKGGFYAQYATLKAEHAAAVPKKLSIQQAGVMAVDAVTALQGLDDTLHLKSGETVMIFGASGGIGHMAIQLAKRMGAKVLAVASGEDGVQLTKKLGADAAVDGHKDDILAAARAFAPQGVDAALVTAGGPEVDQALVALREGGRVAFPNGVEPAPKAPNNIKAQSYNGQPHRQVFEKLNHLIDAGPFEVHIARTFTLERAADAQRNLNEHYLGKLALQPTA